MGMAADYEGLNVEGKIVVAGADQRNQAWIINPLNEAALLIESITRAAYFLFRLAR